MKDLRLVVLWFCSKIRAHLLSRFHPQDVAFCPRGRSKTTVAARLTAIVFASARPTPFSVKVCAPDGTDNRKDMRGCVVSVETAAVFQQSAYRNQPTLARASCSLSHQKHLPCESRWYNMRALPNPPHSCDSFFGPLTADRPTSPSSLLALCCRLFSVFPRVS